MQLGMRLGPRKMCAKLKQHKNENKDDDADADDNNKNAD
jgi:hypothetical protein